MEDKKTKGKYNQESERKSSEHHVIPEVIIHEAVEKQDEPRYYKKYDHSFCLLPDELDDHDETKKKQMEDCPGREEYSTSDSVMCRDGERKIDYVLVYEDQQNPEKEEKRRIFQENLEMEGMFLEIEKLKKLHFVNLHAPWSVICGLAEILKIKKPIEAYEESDHHHDSCSRCFCRNPMGVSQKLVPQEKDYFTADFNTQMMKIFKIWHKKTFFTSAQRSLCVHELLSRTHYEITDATKFGIDRLLREKVYLAAFPLHDGKYELHQNERKRQNNTLHNDRQLLYEIWARFGRCFSLQPLTLIRKYFGEKIAMYFAWLGFYTSMLIPASLVGTAVFLYGLITTPRNTPGHEICDSKLGVGDVDMCPMCDQWCTIWKLKDSCLFSRITYVFDNEATALFSIFMSIWGIIFLEFWKRRQATLQFNWDVNNYQNEERIKPEYEAKVQRRKINPVSKLQEPYLPFYSKITRQLTSVVSVLFMVCLMVCGVFGVVVYRIIVVSYMYTVNNEDIRVFAKLLTSFTAAVVNLIFILIMNRVCRLIAKALTNMEQCRTITEYEDSYTVKVYLFEFVNFYATSFYIAFFKGSFVSRPGDKESLFFQKWRQDECDPSGCLIELCMQLGVVMVGRQAVNNCQEVLIPRIKVFIKTWRAKKAEMQEHLNSRWEQDYVLDEAPQVSLFEEYLEMVIQYGFVTIFVAAFPLAPLVALVNNILEIRIDANKFTTQWKRTPAFRAQDIGIWFNILQAVTFLSVLTNAFIIGWTSDFIPKLMYRFTVSDNMTLAGYVNHSLSYFNISDYDESSKPDNYPPWFRDQQICRYKGYRLGQQQGYIYSDYYWRLLAVRLAFVIVFEHVIALLTWVVAVCIPDVPAHVKLLTLREQRLVTEAKYDFASSLSGTGSSSCLKEPFYSGSYPNLMEMSRSGRRTSTLSGINKLLNSPNTPSKGSKISSTETVQLQIT